MAQPVEGFLRTILKSGLLDRDQLQAAVRAVPRESRDDPQELADQLVKLGKLSAFQAQKLLQGIFHGLVLGQYQVLAPLGRGGMGTVYLAQNIQTREKLAVKVLSAKRREDERYLVRFQREMLLSQRLDHPNLARTYEVGVYQGVYFIAMEYIPGQSLYRLVSKEGPLAVAQAARLFAEVAAALEYAHGEGLIHRDLKPSNIMVTPHGHARVLDLGLALRAGEQDDIEIVGGPGFVVGSFDYIAPEQTEDASRVGPRADIYSFGCSLYFALTRQPPFPGGTTREKIQRHRKEEPVAITSLNSAIPEKFARLVERMMAKQANLRHASAAALRDELLLWAGDEPAQPMDEQGDSAFHQAIVAIETGAENVDTISDVPNVPPPSDLSSSAFEPIPVDDLAQEKKDIWWIILGLAGFWGVILLGLIVVLLFR